MSPEKVVVITGCSSGMGMHSALIAARAGCTVVATMRDPDRAGTLLDGAADNGVSVDVRRMDVTSRASVAACIDGVLDQHGRIDAVINNAGAAAVGTMETQSESQLRAAMEVNFFGVVSVSRTAMPFLRSSRGRLITVTSVGGVVGQPFNDAYCAAKFAVEGYMESLAPVAARVGVQVSLVEPGAVASSFLANAGVNRAEMLTAAGPYRDALDGYLTRTEAQFAGNAQPAEEAAAVIVETLMSSRPPFRVQTSPEATAFARLKLSDLDGSKVQSATGPWLGDN